MRDMPEMDEGLNIPRVLTIGLVYPAVLGSIFYSIFALAAEYAVSGVASGFLAGSASEISVKAGFVLLVLNFFFCDYIYSSWTAPFRVHFMILNLLVLVCLYVAFVGANTGGVGAPNLDLLSLAFGSAFLIYAAWDIFDRSLHQSGKYRQQMKAWEWISVVAVSVSWILAESFAWVARNHVGILLVVLLGSNILFWRLLVLKRRVLRSSPSGGRSI